MKTFRYKKYRRVVNGSLTYRLPSICKNPAADYLAAFEGGVMMPAAMSNKRIKMYRINAKRQLPRRNIDVGESVDFSRFINATCRLHESSQGQSSFTTGSSRSFQACLRAGFHEMKREYRGVTKILIGQIGMGRADLYCLSAAVPNSYTPARKAGCGPARPASRAWNS